MRWICSKDEINDMVSHVGQMDRGIGLLIITCVITNT